MLLIKKHCLPTDKSDMQCLPKKTAQDLHREVSQWTLHQKSLQREFRFKNFSESMAFVRKVADIAEAEGHPPDISIFFNRVGLQLSTSTIGGLSENDFIMAAKIDGLINV
jgi:4a-hydroxytetrahydrobiopterin dehydratase